MFHYAFARLHCCFEVDVRKHQNGEPYDCDGAKYANVEDGLKHMQFVGAAIQSSSRGGRRVVLS